MKILLVSLLIIFGLFFTFQFKPVIIAPSPSPASSPQLATIEYNQQIYSYAYVVIEDIARLKLFSNHAQKLSSQELINQYGCQILVNGNFYDKADQPLGWLVSEGQEFSPVINSALFNGFLSLSASKVEISNLAPVVPISFGLQSGPLLILDQKILPLKINQDEPRRRVVAAITVNGQLVFLVINSPILAEAPTVVSAIGKKINQPFLAAINLDGGSASAFYSPEIFLKEYSYIGSFFCYTKL